ncbi:MAG TPA: TetR family transcriptional regulator [Polyangiales bacterium]
MVLRVNPEKKEEKERVAHTLLRATLRLASAHGFASLGLREVAREAAIAPTSFYRHFADMEQLGLALIHGLVARFLADFLERGREAWQTTGSDDPSELVFALATHALAGVKADPELGRFLVAERVGAVASFRAAIAKQLEQLSNTLQQGFRESATHRPLPAYAADALVVLILTACGRALDAEASMPALGDELRQQLRLILTVTRASQGAAGTP